MIEVLVLDKKKKKYIKPSSLVIPIVEKLSFEGLENSFEKLGFPPHYLTVRILKIWPEENVNSKLLYLSGLCLIITDPVSTRICS